MPRFLLEEPQKILDLVLLRLELSSDQEDFIHRIREDQPVEEQMQFQILGLKWEEDRNLPTSIDGLKVALSHRADAGLSVVFYPAGSNVVLGTLELTHIDDARVPWTVSEGKVVCGFELHGELGVDANASGTFNGVSLGLSAGAKAGTRVRFFKEVDQGRNTRGALEDTIQDYKLPYQLTRPAAGEVVCAEFNGELSLNANVGYGWSIDGTKRYGKKLTKTELETNYSAKAKVGLNAGFAIQGAMSLVVRASPRGGEWANVSFQKRRRSRLDLGLQLNVEAEWQTATTEGKPAGDFVDSLLVRTPIPELIRDFKRFDTPAELSAELGRLKQDAVDRITGEIVELAGPTIQSLDEKYQDVRNEVQGFVDRYHEFNADVVGFATSAMDRYTRLDDVDGLVDEIAAAGTPADLLDKLGGPVGDGVRQVLGLVTDQLGVDLTESDWLDDAFDGIQALIGKYRDKRAAIKDKLEESYRKVRLQLGVEGAVGKIESFLRDPKAESLEALLDEKIVWLNEYLSSRLGDTVVANLVGRMDKVTDALAEITKGYDDKVGKAKAALKKALNQKLSAQISVAWNRTREREALASVDVNLSTAVGKAAYRNLLLGRVGQVLQDRLDHAGSIRFVRSTLVDQLVQGITVRSTINGRENMTVRDFLVRTEAVIEATENGEIWIEKARVESRFRTNRRAMINVATMFEFELEERFDLEDRPASQGGGQRLVSRGVETDEYAMTYSFVEGPKVENTTEEADNVVKRLGEIYSTIDVQTVPQDALNDLALSLKEIGKLGELGDVHYRFDAAFVGDSLDRLFGMDPQDIASKALTAYDRTVREVFDEQPTTLKVYREFVKRGNIPDFWHGRTHEENDARVLLMMRVPFSKGLRKLVGVIQTIQPGGNVAAKRDKLRKQLKELGKKMNYLNSIEGGTSRDFIMTLFAHLADPEDLRGSVIVEYGHPLSPTKRFKARKDHPREEVV